MVTNLVGNAVKFTAHGHILIDVECEIEDAQSARMRVSVHDTGYGVPEQKLGALFQKFSQADSSTSRKYGGTGLGLAICKQLVQLMGGSIGVRSSVGEGSTFWFTLPLELDTHPQAAPVPVADLRELRVLIVDDNEVNRRVLHEHITSWGIWKSRTLALPHPPRERCRWTPRRPASLPDEPSGFWSPKTTPSIRRLQS